MNKKRLLGLILEQLEEDHRRLLQAATSAHSAATHSENIPDNKYETLALEASYIAQGQANRAQEIRSSLAIFRDLKLPETSEETEIRLGVLVLLEDEEGQKRRVFLGPAAGGMKLELKGENVMLITPDSPLGQQLVGKQIGDEFTLKTTGQLREYEILEIS